MTMTRPTGPVLIFQRPLAASDAHPMQKPATIVDVHRAWLRQYHPHAADSLNRTAASMVDAYAKLHREYGTAADYDALHALDRLTRRARKRRPRG
jgi:hypothetical protein